MPGEVCDPIGREWFFTEDDVSSSDEELLGMVLVSISRGTSLLQGARTLWETDDGADGFDLAGSLCHSWSDVPLWYSQACLLGVSPLTPGFSRFRVRPHTAAIPHASGKIPTPHGPIEIAWAPEKDRVSLSVSHPKQTTVDMAAPGISS